MSDNQITVVTEVSQAQITVDGRPVTINETVYSVDVISNSNEVSVSYGSPGAQGPEGPTGPGGGSGATVIAGETISGHRAVAILGGLAYLADPTNPAHGLAIIGVVRDAASIGNSCTYYTAGEITGGSFVSDTDYFVGLLGTLSSTPSAVGATWMKRLGTTVSSSTLVLEFDPTILL